MAHRPREKAEYLVQSVDRALDVLEAFNYQQEEFGVTELSHKLGLHKNNVFRLLATLEYRGYIEQDRRTGNYRLGVKTFEVANIFLHHLGLRRQARPILEDLVTRCDETAYLAILDGTEVVYVLMHETSQTVRIVPRLGHRLPAYCTASGKTQLAYESRDHLAQIFEGRPLKKHTANTIDNFEKLLIHLGNVARLGCAVDDQEFEEGVRCVAAPLKDYSHRVVAAIGLCGPVSRFSLERIEKELVPLVKGAAMKISQRLGYEAVAVATG